jgi:styrene monooxygenase A-like protein/putative NAD(P)-binding protein
MRRVAIIGSGIAGLLCAHALVKAGYAVTLFSDRTADQWLRESRPTGTAGRFNISLSIERELGLNHWDAEAPKVLGAHVTFCPEIGNRLLTLAGLLDRPAMAIDVRLQSHRWMNDLALRGGMIVVEKVTPERLDAIAGEHDLTIVAAGRADLCSLFERDPERSVYDAPQRKLAMVVTRGGAMGFSGVPFLPAKFNLTAAAGEAFWIPFFHKDHGPTWCMLFEAKAGGPLDRFDGAKSAAEVLEIGKGVIKESFPWDHAWTRDMVVADDLAWLVGSVTPTVRRPVAKLPSGRVVTPLGDTSMSLDPIGGQGANNGTKMARHLADAIVARGDQPFDAAWMTETFNRFWSTLGEVTNRFNNLLLEPMTEAGKEILIAQYGSDGRGDGPRQSIANAFADNFDDPRSLTATFQDLELARSFIAGKMGRSWVRSAVTGRLAIAAGQIRQKLGMPPNHPVAPAPAPQ